MAAKKGGLGKKGIDLLINNKIDENPAEEKPAEKPDEFVDIDKVEPNKDQPRKKFDEDELIELSESIKQYGIIQPIIVVDRKDYYEIVAGERRWRAARKAGLKKVPVIIKDYTDQEILLISLIENIQRQDLNPIEEALTYKRLLTESDLKQDELAEKVSKSRTAVTNSIRLLKLQDEVQQMLIDEMLSIGQARPLISVENPEKQIELAQEIFDKRLNAREAEKLVKKYLSDNQNKKEKEKEKSDEQLKAVLSELEEKMKMALGTKVSINNKDNTSGKIEIEYYSKEELERIYDLLMSASNN